MFVAITNTPRDYAWGSMGEISALLGLPASGAPEAELWLGAHPGSPSRVVGSDQTLLDVVDGRLPFLLKVLAAESPLSLQAHPNAAQAAAGFERENALGIPLDAANRNYKDAFHKPELIYALRDGFEALCGFRPTEETRESLRGIAPAKPLLDRLSDDSEIQPTFAWLISRQDGVDDLVAELSRVSGPRGGDWQTVARLARLYPGDPGIAISLMLNRVTLAAGEALYLPAGVIHAYLRGLGIELMSASDNVLRGGLTRKHVDVPELLDVLEFHPTGVPRLQAGHPAPGVDLFRPSGSDLMLARVDGTARVVVTGASIVLCTEGELTVKGAQSSTIVSRGDAVYVTADEGWVETIGQGRAFIATTG